MKGELPLGTWTYPGTDLEVGVDDGDKLTGKTLMGLGKTVGVTRLGGTLVHDKGEVQQVVTVTECIKMWPLSRPL